MGRQGTFIERLTHRVLAATLGAWLALPAWGAVPVIRYAIFPAPPFMIGAAQEHDPVSGIDVEIAQELARRMGCELRFIRAPWIRCLDLMKTGRADLLSSAFKTPERQVYMDYLSKPFLRSLPIAFYFRADSGISIDRYEDLYRLKGVGVLREASYFKRFDEDPRIAKVPVTSQDQLFPMVASGRMEVMAGYVDTENYRLVTEGYRGRIVRSRYLHDDPVEVFFAVSKKSPLRARLKELDEFHRQLLREGFIQDVIQQYKRRYE